MVLKADIIDNIRVVGSNLDCHNYLDFLSDVQEELDSGATALVIDLSDVQRICLSGLVALYLAGLYVKGEAPAGSLGEIQYLDGWQLICDLERAIEKGDFFHKIAIIAPAGPARNRLYESGVARILPVCANISEALGRLQRPPKLFKKVNFTPVFYHIQRKASVRSANRPPPVRPARRRHD